MNNVAVGISELFQAVKKNRSLVCLRLRNNNLDGRKIHQELFELVMNHPTLTAIDLGNSESIKNRNRVYNEGFSAIIEAMCYGGSSLISELHFQSAQLNSKCLQVMHQLQDVACDLQILNLANNDLGNEVASCLKPVFKTLVSLNLSNTRLGCKGCLELAFSLG